MAVTDRIVEADLARRGIGEWEVDAGRVCLCVSLALPFRGFAYKLVAGIIWYGGV